MEGDLSPVPSVPSLPPGQAKNIVANKANDDKVCLPTYLLKNVSGHAESTVGPVSPSRAGRARTVRKRYQRCTTVGWSSNLWLLHWAGGRGPSRPIPPEGRSVPPRDPSSPTPSPCEDIQFAGGWVRGLDKRLQRPPKQLPSGTIPHPRVWGEWGARGPRERPQANSARPSQKKPQTRHWKLVGERAHLCSLRGVGWKRICPPLCGRWFRVVGSP